MNPTPALWWSAAAVTRDADPERAWDRIRRSRSAIGKLLLDQSVVAVHHGHDGRADVTGGTDQLGFALSLGTRLELVGAIAVACVDPAGYTVPIPGIDPVASCCRAQWRHDGRIEV